MAHSRLIRLHFRRTLLNLTVLGIILVCMGLTLGHIGSWWWFFDLFSHFRLQYAFGLFVLFCLSIAQRRLVPSVVCALALLIALVPIARYYFSPAVGCSGDSVRLLSYNVFRENPEKEEVIRVIRESNADVVALYEVDLAWVRALRELESAYPFTAYFPRSDDFGIALLSRVEIDGAREHYFGNSGVPSVIAEVVGPDGPLFLLICTHPVPPVSRDGSRRRNEQLSEIKQFLKGEGRHDVVLAGDLNATPWSASLKQFGEVELRDSRLGFGISPTWMRALPWIAIPIDHVFVGPDVGVREVGILDATGSDHNPLFADLCLKTLMEDRS